MHKMGSRLTVLTFACVCIIFVLVSSYRSSIANPFGPAALVPSISSSLPLSGTPTNNYAFSAFLAAPASGGKNDNDDLYFVGTRMMIYQLLHDPGTRTNNSYPFIVLVTEDVSEYILLCVGELC